MTRRQRRLIVGWTLVGTGAGMMPISTGCIWIAVRAWLDGATFIDAGTAFVLALAATWTGWQVYAAGLGFVRDA